MCVLTKVTSRSFITRQEIKHVCNTAITVHRIANFRSRLGFCEMLHCMWKIITVIKWKFSLRKTASVPRGKRLTIGISEQFTTAWVNMLVTMSRSITTVVSTLINNFCTQQYLRELFRAINEDKANVFGYTVWAFLDGFEFSNGFQWVWMISGNEAKRAPSKPRSWIKNLFFLTDFRQI